MNQPWLRRIWGEAPAFLSPLRRAGWIDLLIMIALAGFIFGLVDLAHEWTGEHRPTITIDLDDPWTLPRFTFYSLTRGLLAYVISLTFTLCYGYWAAKDPLAERVLIPLLDILQSIPVLGFMPGVVLALVGLFPHSNIGLELAAILMIFTGQAWNMTFSFYHSVKSVPQDQREVATVYRFSWWQRFQWVELPFSMMGLVWNSMMSMAGGWFFLTAVEALTLGDQDFRLPGIGSYMKVAVDEERADAMIWAMIAMVVMIVVLDQLLWRPVVAWAQKFRTEEGGQQEEVSSWFLDWLRRSNLLTYLGSVLHRGATRTHRKIVAIKSGNPSKAGSAAWATSISFLLFCVLVAGLGYGAWSIFQLLQAVSWSQWGQLILAGLLTLGRVLLATALSTLIALPAGLAIGLSPRLSRTLQPVIQVVASFPAPMLYYLLVPFLLWIGVWAGWGSVLLMLLGTLWYILFNVVAGTMAIPTDLIESSRSYHIEGWQRFWTLYVPAVFPYLVTGWVTAAGGAWNTSILAEFVQFKKNGVNQVYQTMGLGAEITKAAESKQFPLLAASILVMACIVVTFNRTVWHRCYRLAERRFSLDK